jgi:predicted metal-binding protein
MPSLGHDKADMTMEELIQAALRFGASAASVISASEISVEDNLAGLCKKPQCVNFGLSPSCPPHVSGPDGFRSLLEDFRKAIVVKIDVPLAVLLSDERRDVMQLLHEIVAGVEQSAVQMGFINSKAFAGGSCKQIFCRDHPDCRVLNEGGECRNAQYARPSMSGFGINVTKLMRAAGFNADKNSMDNESNSDSMSWVSGLVLIG